MWKFVIRFPKRSDFEYDAAPGMCATMRVGLQQEAADVVVNRLAEFRGGDACGKMRGGGGENIAAVKCPADFFERSVWDSR